MEEGGKGGGGGGREGEGEKGREGGVSCIPAGWLAGY